MKKSFLLLTFFFLVAFSLSAQTYKYNFNNNFTEAGGIGPNLSEVLDLGCPGPPVAGAYSSQVIDLLSGTCGTATPKTVFDFNAGGGISFPNASFINGGLTASYTIHILFKFNSISPAGSSVYKRIIDFSDGASDRGYYNVDESYTAYAPSGFTYFNLSYPFASNKFTLCTVVRDGTTNLVSLYFNGVLHATTDDASAEFVPTTSTTPITFFRDDAGGCESGAGSIKYLSISNTTSTNVQVSNEFTSICSSTLPLRMIDFSASKQNDNSILLKWITDNEENTSHFELERSAPNSAFSKIGNIITNNIVTRSNYNFSDRFPLPGTNLYRLKIYDKDGQYKYSNVLKVTTSGKPIFEVFPNPAKDVITITGIRSNETIKLLNAEGKIVMQKVSTGQSTTIDVSKFPSGMYIITYFDGEQTQRQKVIKQ